MLDPHPIDRFKEYMVDLVDWGWDSKWVMNEATLLDYYEIAYAKMRKSAVEQKDNASKS